MPDGIKKIRVEQISDQFLVANANKDITFMILDGAIDLISNVSITSMGALFLGSLILWNITNFKNNK